MSSSSDVKKEDENKNTNKDKPAGDFSTAILDRKKAPNRLLVDEATADDNSVISLHPGTHRARRSERRKRATKMRFFLRFFLMS